MSTNDSARDAGENPEKLRDEIEQTRGELGGTINAIQERLQPQHLMEQAKESVQETTEHVMEHAKHAAQETATTLVEQTKEAVHSATIGKVEHMVSSVTETAKDFIGGQRSSQTTRPSIMQTVKGNPIPAAFALGGLGWLWTHRTSGSTTVVQGQSEYEYESRPAFDSRHGQSATGAIGEAAATVQDKAGQVIGQTGNTVASTASHVGETANQVGQKAGQVAGQTGSQFQRLMQENPLTVGVAAIGLGAALGLVVPETQQESQVMGQARDTLMDKATQTVQETMGKVGTIAQKAEVAAEGAVKEEAKAQGLS